MVHDAIVVGGGIVGLATAHCLLQARPALRLLLLEKEPRLAAHQTGHNSGVLHAGLYYRPGSQKARLCARGLQQMVAFCRERGIPHEICGKIVVATSAAELPRLEALWERGRANGLAGLRRLTSEQLREIEPHAAGVAGIHVPQEGIVDYPAVAHALGELIRGRGGEVRLSTRCLRLVPDAGGWTVATAAGDLRGRFVVTCGGLHADRLVRASGLKPSARIVPFRGEYYRLREGRRHLVRNLIYPVPDPRFPFLGVHFTRLVHGGVEAGPNAVLAAAREGYRWTTFNMRDFAESMTFPGLWRFLAAHPGRSWYEVRRSFSKREFCRSLQRLVPEIRAEDLETGGAGVRAQAMTADGRLVEDFRFDEARGILHVVNAPSPAATAALAIGATIAERVLAQLPGRRAGLAAEEPEQKRHDQGQQQGRPEREVEREARSLHRDVTRQPAEKRDLPEEQERPADRDGDQPERQERPPDPFHPLSAPFPPMPASGSSIAAVGGAVACSPFADLPWSAAPDRRGP